MRIDFKPPPFVPHRLYRGGHLQTLAAVVSDRAPVLMGRQHVVELPDGDAVVLHENGPPGWVDGDPAMLLVHGLCGCHAAPYMIRLASQFSAKGFRVFRLDMRGCGAAFDLSMQLTHAGRGGDLVCALDRIAELAPGSPLGVIAVSLGGNQLLRSLGRIGKGIDSRPDWFDRLVRVAAVSPPIDLLRCSENMQRRIMWPYNYYFVRQLLSRVPPRVRQRPDFQQQILKRRPRSLRELDDQLTAPLSGFATALDYYRESSAAVHAESNPVPTLILAAADDPVVPIDCFEASVRSWPVTTRVCISEQGGHVGFIDRNRDCWMDRVLADWFGLPSPTF
ncbi:YheT family hydrolase [Novipirellula artificiosorum]|uniref:Putative hydrolase n=1 Tax=Novipirellula artificiosorum TaxID=2528016 RepID=A0A5C6E3M2_9BACT|nr:alpha/beta fold hydrolase [Novipirellula artificiosorum]TWU42036.1 putative hydrolase [Novipirellula artificiosorum]